MIIKDIFTYCVGEETNFSLPISVNDWEWNFPEHIKTSFFYKHGRLLRGNSDDKPVKNIIRPILNLQYRAEGFDVKDIIFFVNDPKNYYKSFLIKKFHENWARKNKIDTAIDESVESYVDYGGVLVKNINTIRPEIVPLQSIAFCDQTDILSGPIAIKHFYSPDQLREMEQYGWGDTKNGATATLEEFITLSQTYKVQDLKQSRTPGKYIEIYEIHGTFPNSFLKDNGDDKYTSQLHIIGFYGSKTGGKNGLTLFKGAEKELPFKFLKRDPIYGRAMGFGGAEELFEPQVWTNYSEIRRKELLDAAARMIHLTDDESFYARNKSLKNVDNNAVLTVADGKTVKQMDTYPRSIALFEKATNDWENYAKLMGSAQEAIMGEQPPAGTPFSSVQFQAMQSQGTHEYRKGKLAAFWDEIYQDWIIPYISKEITKEQEFLSELDLDELQQVADALVINQANNMIKEKILNGELINDAEVETFKQNTREQFMKGGNKRFIKIFQGEFKNVPVDVKINIAGKQKYLSAMTDKLTNIFRQIIASPQVLDDPRMAKIFNQILEASGLSPIDFYSKPQSPIQPSQPAKPAPLLAPQPAMA